MPYYNDIKEIVSKH